MPFLPSGVNRNIGRMKMRYQTADSGPVARASSPSLGSSPKIGSTPMIVLPVSGDPAMKATTKISTIMPPR